MNIDVDGDGKPDVSLNIQQIILIFSTFAAIIGSYYSLKSQISSLEVRVEEAMSSPKQEVSKASLNALEDKIDLKLDKVSVQAKENMDNLKDFEREVRNGYRRNR
jgi:hypothetical protein